VFIGEIIVAAIGPGALRCATSAAHAGNTATDTTTGTQLQRPKERGCHIADLLRMFIRTVIRQIFDRRRDRQPR
jgi:hypothetical protein